MSDLFQGFLIGSIPFLVLALICLWLLFRSQSLFETAIRMLADELEKRAAAEKELRETKRDLTLP